MLQNAPSTTATTVRAAISKPYLRMADSGMAIIPILVCHHHSGGLSGIFLANSKIRAARIHATMHTITGAVMSLWTPAKPSTATKKNQPTAPQANWRPTSARPDDVSRVAIMMAVFNSVIIDTGKRSAMMRMVRYDQYVTKRSPSICEKYSIELLQKTYSSTLIYLIFFTSKHWLSANTLGSLYGLSTSHSIIGLQFVLFMYFFM